MDTKKLRDAASKLNQTTDVHTIQEVAEDLITAAEEIDVLQAQNSLMSQNIAKMHEMLDRYIAQKKQLNGTSSEDST